MGIHVRFGAGDEEGSGQMQHMEPGEIDIAPIHDVDRARLRKQQVKRVNVVQLAIRNVDEARDITAQVQQRVHLDRRLDVRKCAHGKTARQRSMVVESSA